MNGSWDGGVWVGRMDGIVQGLSGGVYVFDEDIRIYRDLGDPVPLSGWCLEG